MIPLPTWMRRALFVTAVMNILAAVCFLPGAGALRDLAGFPAAGEPFYLMMVAMFVLLFGLGYLWAARAGHADRLFIGVAAVGKLTFFALVFCFWAAGALPLRAPATAAGDLLFGLMFVAWLRSVRSDTVGLSV